MSERVGTRGSSLVYKEINASKAQFGASAATTPGCNFGAILFMKEQRGFKGVWIDRDIWLRKDITPTDKCVLAEIDSLDNENGCYASNAFLAENLSVSISTIQRSVKTLEDLGLIIIEYPNNLTRIIRLKRYSQNDRGMVKMTRGYGQNDHLLEYKVSNIHIASDGFDNYPKEKHIDCTFLPAPKIKAVIERFKRQKSITVDFSFVEGMFTAFKQQYFNGEKFYNSANEIYSHFSNWVINQKIGLLKDKIAPSQPTNPHIKPLSEVIKKYEQ